MLQLQVVFNNLFIDAKCKEKNLSKMCKVNPFDGRLHRSMLSQNPAFS